MIKRPFPAIILLSLVVAVTVAVSGCSPKTAENGNTVKVHYTGKLQDGEVFDSSVEGDPLEITLGQGQVIPGFEQAVTGMQVGESKTVIIPVEQAYGAVRSDLIFEVSREELPEDINPEVGMQIQSSQPDGSVIMFTVTEVAETAIMVDGNHPLAGKELTFDIELVEIVKAAKSGSGLTSVPLQEALANGKPTLAELGSDTCIPCKQMKPILEQLAADYKGRVNIVIVDVYDNMDLTRQYNILAIPTQIVFDKYGKEITRHTGVWSREDIIAQFRNMGISQP